MNFSLSASYQIPLSTNLLFVHKIYNGYWFSGRPTLENLHQGLHAVLKKCQPDWDVTTPEIRVVWQEGRKELF